MGVDVFDGGVMNTPSASYIVQAHKFQSGVVISASHNPSEFNGIKFFNPQGVKWPDIWEEKVEDLFFKWSGKKGEKITGKIPGVFVEAASLTGDYEDFLIESLGPGANLAGLKIAVDCANGANHLIGPEVLKRMGLDLVVISDRPDGKNINHNCGSLHTNKLAAVVRRNKCDAGVAFDGDGDRVIFVDEKGMERDGDFLIAILAKSMKERRILKENLAVITVMANLGLKKALKKQGIRTMETPVGDRYVSQAMKKNGSVLGGEQSGHIILGDHLNTGDGLLTALHVLSILKQSNMSFLKLAGWVHKYPQVLLNVPVKEKKPLDSLNGASKTIQRVQKTLGDNGRVLIRYSGTEPLLRIMIEGPEQVKCGNWAREIADAILAEI